MAVLIIAFVFTETIAWTWLGAAAMRSPWWWPAIASASAQWCVYVALGAFIWLAFLESGVHPTVAGVLLGLLTCAAVRVAVSADSSSLS